MDDVLDPTFVIETYIWINALQEMSVSPPAPPQKINKLKP